MFFYFLSTRILRNPSQIALFLVQYVVPSAILAERVGLGPAGVTASTLWALLGFILVYEVGYLYNDFFDRYGARKKVSWLKSRWAAVALIGTNVAFVIGLFALQHIAIGEVGVYAAVLGIFIMHTILAPQKRTATFVALNFAKVAFFGATVTGATTMAVTVVALAIVLPQAWKYWASKTRQNYVPSNWLSMFLSLVCTFAVSFTISSVAAILVLASFFALTVRSKRRASVARARDVVSHAHTDLSHDATIQLSDYDRIPHHVYLTDHAEDVDAPAFENLHREASVYPGKFTVGLEFPWATEHILAVNLREPILHPVQSLEELSKVVDELIWAHPNPAVRRLVKEPEYRRMIWNIFRTVDSIEWYNIKTLRRGPRFGRRNSVWATLFHLVKGAERFYVGADLHHVKDFEALNVGTSEAEKPTVASARVDGT